MTPRTWLARAAILLVGLLACALSQSGAAPEPPKISFAVHTLKEENVEGPDVERSYFTAGEKKIVFGKPKGARLSIDDSGLVILLTEAGLDGEIHVGNSSFTPEFDLAANALKYRAAAADTMPRAATGIEVLQPVMNPYPFNDWKSLGFTWTYVFSGRSMIRTVSYINLEIGAQVIVTTLAAKTDAEKVEKIAKQFMSSWWVKDSR